MILHDVNPESQALHDRVHAISAVYCKLFSDTVTTKICTLRKQELNGTGGFSCDGCTMERC